MKVFLTAIAAALLLWSGAAQARHHRSHLQYLDPGCNVIFPCTPMAGQRASEGGLLGHARSIRVTMHRVRETHRRPRQAHRMAVAHRATKLQDRIGVTLERGRGVVRSVSGVVAYVATSATGAFQCLVSSLDDAGYKIAEMGGFARSGHIRHSKHYSGMAIDINQIERNVVTRRFPIGFEHMAMSCGLESGSRWRNADTGHFEIPGKTLYASARHHHHRTRYARRRHHEEHRYAGAG